jgi:hypothetical protein
VTVDAGLSAMLHQYTSAVAQGSAWQEVGAGLRAESSRARVQTAGKNLLNVIPDVCRVGIAGRLSAFPVTLVPSRSDA